ncbi:hypothetical protein M0R45_007964 [Rubus argutus]|uniref:AAA+ ATPase domain-containing protein n=1 Tax=Rubus argutus TaxID=59490 RepID=A0AAW1XZZ8_RUBAR
MLSPAYEANFIDDIVEKISKQLKELSYLNVAKYPVGVEFRVQQMLECLDVRRSDTRMVGIWGTGGIGKTTIAKAVYNSISYMFEGSCFLANVREESEVHGGLLNLQNILLSKIVGGKEVMVTNVYEGITLLKERLRHKRILLVLDDVNKPDQLDKLAGATDWFGCGSRIIITTRDKHLLIVHQVIPIYKARELDHDDARELFRSYAFKTKTNLDENEKLSVNAVVRYAQGLPLALKVLGSHLCCRPIHQWQAELDGYRREPNQDIQKILKISYDDLEQKVKEVFLDIACFFKGRTKNDVIQTLESCGRINPTTSIEVLVEKALINVEYHITMHDLLEEMGKDIVHQESPKEPGERSRLWHPQDVLQVLTENTGTSKIEGILANMSTEDEIRLNSKCFKKMRYLKFFINVNARFCGKVEYLPEQLRLLDWPKYPFQSLPSNFKMKKLIQLSMPQSRISSLGEGFKRLQNLTSMNFSECKFLTKIPDLSGTPNLERLLLSGCTSLVEVHPSVGLLDKLVDLFLLQCSNLVMLPRKVNWRSLKHINLSYCKRLENFPEIVGEMKYLTSLMQWHCGIKELPSSIRHLINLESLYLEGCENFTNLPCSIHELQKLECVSFKRCPKLITFPNKDDSHVLPTHSKVSHDNCDSLSETGSDDDGCSSLEPDNFALSSLRNFNARGCNLSNFDFLASLDCASTLHELDLSGSTSVILPKCINKFVSLWKLNLSDCSRLVEIPKLPPRIHKLDVTNCISLERISKLSNILERKESQMIKKMDLTNCWKLCQNFVQMAEKEDVFVNDHEVDADLFSLFLSSQRSEFTVTFPGRTQVPKWFSCQMDFKGYQRFEFCIEILPNFKWVNTGLALCVAVDQKLQNTSTVCSFFVLIRINHEDVEYPYSREHVDSEGSDHVWLHYFPFREMHRVSYMRPPPFMCRVIIFQRDSSEASLKSCGVHLVMPPNGDVCMKLSRAENLSNELPEGKDSYFDDVCDERDADESEFSE